MDDEEIALLCEGEWDKDYDQYVFRDPCVQGQWEAWQAALNQGDK